MRWILDPTLLIVGSISLATSADWYVATTGLDTNPGTQALPFATVTKAAGVAKSGDRILLRKGGSWRADGLALPAGISVLPYGSGNPPELTAATGVTMTGTGAIRTASVAAPVLACYVNGAFMPLARYPNTGWLRCDTGTTKNQIVDADPLVQHAAGRWAGAQIRWRRWSWWFETRPITADTGGGTLSLSSEGAFSDSNVGIGSGYFVDNDLDELDAPGEWYWGGGTLHLMPPSGVDPATMRVTVVTTTTGITSSASAFSGIAFRRFFGTALSQNAPVTIENCTFEQLERTAAYLTWNSAPAIVRSCTFRDVRSIGLNVNQDPAKATGTVIERNTFQRIGMQPGYGGNGSWILFAVLINSARQAVVQLNRITDVGQTGIMVDDVGQTIRRNVVVRAMANLNDGAAIKLNCNNSIVEENIIVDPMGNLETSHPWWPLGHGIWSEFLNNPSGQQIRRNTVFGANGHGIFLPENRNATIADNVLVDNRLGAIGLSAKVTTAQNHSITGNVLAVALPTRRVQRPEWLQYPTSVAAQSSLIATGTYAGSVDFGTCSGNHLVVPTGQRAVGVGDASYDTAAAWRTACPSWADATASSSASRALLLVNDTEAAATMTVPAGTWTLVDGSAVGTTISVAPFRSVVLLSATAIPTSQAPIVAASGANLRAGALPSVAPELEVKRGNAVIADGGQDVLGSLPVGSTSSVTYSIRNSGSRDLHLLPCSITDKVGLASAYVGTAPATVVAPGATTSLVLVLKPSATTWSLRVSLANDDGDEGPATWRLGSTVIAAAPAVSDAVDGAAVAEPAVAGGAGDAGGCGAGVAALALVAGCAGLGLRRRFRA
jgi:hypothetical protein